MQRPGADAAHQIRVAELLFARGFIGEIAERPVHWLHAHASRTHPPCARTCNAKDPAAPGVAHLALNQRRSTLCSQDARRRRAWFSFCATPPESAGPRQMPCMRGLAPAMASTFATPCAVSRDCVQQDRPLHAVLGFQQRQQLIHVMDVPRSLDLRHHDHIELIADVPRRAPSHHPRCQGEFSALMRAQYPTPAPAKVETLAHLNRACARGVFRVGRNRVFQIGQDQHRPVWPCRRRGRSQLLIMGRHKMDHPLEPHRQLATEALARRSPSGAKKWRGGLVTGPDPVLFASAA